jgi:hypothetical protein
MHVDLVKPVLIELVWVDLFSVDPVLADLGLEQEALVKMAQQMAVTAEVVAVGLVQAAVAADSAPVDYLLIHAELETAAVAVAVVVVVPAAAGFVVVAAAAAVVVFVVVVAVAAAAAAAIVDVADVVLVGAENTEQVVF